MDDNSTKSSSVAKSSEIAHSSSEADDSEHHSNAKWSSRLLFSSYQNQELYKLYAENNYPSKEEKETLARRLNITAQQVTRWFENTRYRCKNTHRRPTMKRPEMEVQMGTVSAKANDGLGFSGTGRNLLKRKEIKMAKKKEREEQKRLKTKADEDRPCHFTKVQRSELKKAFARDKYLSVLARRRLAESLQLTKRQVHAWFRTQRLEYRKELAKANMEKEHQKMAKRTKDGVSEQGEAKKTPFPTQELCKIFEKQKYLSFLERETLARRLELTAHQIARWFTQKRCKEKAEKKKQLNGTETIMETANATEKSVEANQETDMDHCFKSAIPPILYDECGNEHFPLFHPYLETASASSTHEWLEYRKDLEKANLEKEQQEKAKRTEDFVSEQGEVETEESAGFPKEEAHCRAKKTPFPSQELCRIFEKQKYLSALERKTLASRLALTPHQVARWFTQKRCKEKAKAAKEKQLKGTETIMETARRSEKPQDLVSVEDNQNMEKNACFESAIPPFLYDERGNEHLPLFDPYLETTSASSTFDYNTNDKTFTELKPPQSSLPLPFVPNPYIFQDTYDPVSNGTIQPPNYSSTNGDPPFYLSRVWDPILQIWKKY